MGLCRHRMMWQVCRPLRVLRQSTRIDANGDRSDNVVVAAQMKSVFGRQQWMQKRERASLWCAR